jgi:hypothetical protein
VDTVINDTGERLALIETQTVNQCVSSRYGEIYLPSVHLERKPANVDS